MKYKILICLILSSICLCVNANDLEFGELDFTNNTSNITNKGIIQDTTVKYKSLSLAAMSNINSDANYSYANGGCVSSDSISSIFFDQSLKLPSGSLIVSAVLLYSDVSEGDLDFQLYKSDGLGGFNSITSFSVPSISGSGQEGRFLWEYVSFSESYIVRAYPRDNTSANPCLIRVGYVPREIADDIIFLNSFNF